MRPLPLQSVCVWPCLWQHSHTPQRLLVELLGAEQEQSSRCYGEDAGETRILLLWGGTPLDSCGNHLLRTLSANTQFHPVALPPFPPVSACPFREDPSHTHLQGRNGEGTAGKTAGVEARPDLSLLEPRAGLPCWGQVLGLIGKTVFWLLFCRSMEGPSTPILQRPRRFLPFTQELGPKNIRSQV